MANYLIRSSLKSLAPKAAASLQLSRALASSLAFADSGSWTKHPLLPHNKSTLGWNDSSRIRKPALAAPRALSCPLSTIARPVENGQLLKNVHAAVDTDEYVDEGAAAKQPAMHPGLKQLQATESYMLMHPVYSEEDLEVKITHKKPTQLIDRLAYASVGLLRSSFDYFTGYGPNMTEAKWLQRFIFLETVAGVPGMVGAMIRHLHSLRLMRRDMGWIHTLLEEAENERMHLLTFLKFKEPGPVFRTMVVAAQGVFCNFFFLAYLLSPQYCHRFVGYLEEEACRTYTHAIHDLESGKLPKWENTPAPEIAVAYWKLDKDAKMIDLLKVVRADEACHRHVNHTFADLKNSDPNPFPKGASVH